MSANTRDIKPSSYIDLALGIVVVVSIAIVAIPQEWLQTSYELELSRYPAQILGDGYTGGHSEARWVDKDALKWECELKPGAQDPFCSMQLDITNKAGVGLDLSRFDSMTIWAEYRGSAKQLRLYLRNRHPNYYVPGIEISTKYNMIEVPVAELATGLKLSMNNFTVATWWLIGGNVPHSFSHPEFNEVAIIELQTSAATHSGTHEIQVKKISLNGTGLTQGSPYQVVISAWSAIVFCMLCYRFFTVRSAITRRNKLKEDLTAISTSLSLESQAFEELKKTDSLTGLGNRVGIRDILYSGLVEWRDKKVPFSFVMIDLDNFKNFRHSYGHDIGDGVLKDAAKLMSDNLRQTDVLTRWSGEQFALACPNTNLDQAEQIAEKLRVVLETQLKGKDKPVTASFGVASMTEANVEKLLKDADLALYRAKQYGSNRVCVKLPDDGSLSGATEF